MYSENLQSVLISYKSRNYKTSKSLNDCFPDRFSYLHSICTEEDIDIGPKVGIPLAVTVENVDYITFAGDGFIGLKDYTTTAMIREISPDSMTITLFYHEYMGDPENDGQLYLRPCLELTLSYDAR